MVVRKVLARCWAPWSTGRSLHEGGSNRLSYLLLTALLISAWTSPIRTYEENDFDFGDRQRGTLLDDEDMMNDEGSGPEDGEYSGTTSEEIIGGDTRERHAPTRSVFPSYTATASHEMSEIEQYRSVINFTTSTLPYSVALNTTNSSIYVYHARSIKTAIESIFDYSVPGQQTVTVSQFRLASAAAGAPQSVMVTVDLHTSGFYDRLKLFTVLNNAINTGALGSYGVSATGFEFRPLTGGDVVAEVLPPACPSTIGRPPTSMPRLGDTRASLLLGNRFTCGGWLERLDYFRGSRDGSAFLGVWSKTGTLDYVMKGLVELPPAPIGIHSVQFERPLRVEQGDFLGIHYPSRGVPSGVIAYAIPEDNVIPAGELYQVLMLNVREEAITPYRTLNLGDDEELEYEQRAFALQGFLRSDETRVPTITPSRPKPTCSPETQFRCSNGACIDARLECDGQFDCTDRSDEYNCPTPASPTCNTQEFLCNSGQCIDARSQCDGRVDCQDGSDEFDDLCHGGREIACEEYEFACQDGECIDNGYVCDGRPDCRDGSDEDDCDPPVPVYTTAQPITTTRPSTPTPRRRPQCRSNQYQCLDGRCIEERQRCDGRTDCSEEEDENIDYCEDCPENPESPVDGWVRRDGSRAVFGCHTTSQSWQLNCIRRRWVGQVGNCTQRDGLPRICSSADFQCRDGTCIPASAQCDRKYDCTDYSDEINCTYTPAPPVECTQGEFQCRDGDCIDRRRRCDNNYDCRDGSDELDCYTPPPSRLCAAWEFRCQDGTCIDDRLRCNRAYDCPDGTDETVDCDEPTPPPPIQCTTYEFRCDDGTCIDDRLPCDGRSDCPDGSDETRNCDVTPDATPAPAPPDCSQWEFRCRDGTCIDDRRKCDRAYDCADGSDESDCDFRQTQPPPRACSSWEFRCGDGTCIDDRLKCNQHNDCSDGSDETAAADCESISLSASPGEIRIREGMTATFVCRSQGGSPQLRWSRDDDRALPRQAVDDYSGRLTISDAGLEDSGVYTCTTIDTRGQYEAKVTLNVDLVYGPTQIPPGPRQCYTADEFMCNNRACIPPDYRCDGDYDCTDRSDEENCRDDNVSCEPNEFRCTTSNKCILKIWMCDGDDDCGGDRSDEVGCDARPSQFGCRSDEFQCSTGGQCIPAGYQCDGERDCLDNSDESGCSRPTAVKVPPREIMVHVGERIVIDCEAIGIPPPLIVWRLNWGHVGQAPRVTTTSERIEDRPGRPVTGRGVITIEQARKEDEGAYTCEALNSMGSLFVEPDTIVHVLPPIGVCSRGYFNAEAHVSGECIRCFCFGHADDCTSSSQFLSEISIGNALEVVDRINRRPLDASVYRYDGRSREFVIRDYSRAVRGSGYYWSLPKHFLGNKVTSYGGKLTYTVSYTVSPGARPRLEPGPDLILTGNDVTLYHNAFAQPFAGAEQTITVPLQEASWSLDEHGGRKATRENIMTALQNIDYVLIKSSYDRDQDEVRLSRVALTVTSPQTTSLGRAVLVEQCSNCPVGYTGPSCEQCSPGFRRTEEKGEYIGQCVGCNCHGHSNECDPRTGLCVSCQHNTEGDRCDRCKPGFVGDATRGTPNDCRPCPCPAVDGRPSECYIESDGEISCRGCPPGYTGRQCKSCAPGYQIQPGGVCSTGGGGGGPHCDPRGSLSVTADPYTGLCQCKQFADGPTCSRCREHSFYPADINPYGCVPCFCMGVTQACTSTTWSRAQLTVAFRSDPQGFVLTDRDRNENITDGITVSRQRQEIVFSTFHHLPKREYYWSLPARFLKNKVTSYGGHLRFTVQHLPGFDTTPTRYPDVEISGNDIVLEYINNVPIPANSPTSIKVPFYENHWRRADGTMATREHLMMVLAEIEFIMIKAKYTEDSSESSLRDVSLDVAEDRNTGQEKAYAVEQCSCPPGYRGLSCEFCDTGYRRSGGGLYLGTCEPCDCFGHSSECDTTTGLCRNCQHNTAGDRCDVCAPGYYGDATRGQPNDCLPCPCPLSSSPNQFSQECYLADDGQVTCSACPPGHVGRRCESCARGYTGDPSTPGDYCRPRNGDENGDCRCDPRGVVPNTRCDSRSGQCQCKVHTAGIGCNECRPGYFGLSQANPSGCLACHCSGLTKQCSSSRYYKSQIKPVFQSDGSHNFALTTKRLTQQIIDGFRVNAPANEISFEGFDDVQRQGESLYWSLPPRFRGSQVASYGGSLKFLLSYSAIASRGRSYQDSDVVLVSGDETLYTNLRSVTEAPTRHEIQLVESSFRQIDGTSPTRETFLNVLAKLDAILVRATYHTSMQRSALRDVSLDTAVTYNTGQEIASLVEYCSCPTGYTGLSCEECVAGYSRVQVPGHPLGTCISCSCHGHSTSCDPSTGACRNCQHNTEGDRCDRCAAGYYGDPRSGGPHDCRPCPCPLTNPGNQFSRTCYLDDDGSPTCDRCADGYTGRQCDQCADGYVGNPRQPGGSCTPQSGSTFPKVTITPLRLSTTVGGSVTFRCDAQGQGPINVQWMRSDGRPLPDRAVVGRDNSLRITDLRPSDSGRYICAAVNAFGRSEQDAELSVVSDRHLQVIVDEPKRQSITEGSNVHFYCKGISPNVYTVAWTRKDGRPLDTRAVDDGQGTLTIRSVRREDVGAYLCTGSDFYDVATDEAYLEIRGGDQAPVAKIDPGYVTASAGEAVELRCIVSGYPTPRIDWSGGPNGVLPIDAIIENDVLRFPAVTQHHQGEYHCTAVNQGGRSSVRAVLVVEEEVPGFEVVINQPELKIRPGEEARVDCVARSHVKVEAVEWTKFGDTLPPGAYQIGGQLVIPECKPEFSGRYVCTIYLINGDKKVAYSSISITDDQFPDRLEAPQVTLNPDFQTVNEGSTGTIRCDATGNPTPVVTWSRARGVLGRNHQVHGNMLRILQATDADSDSYICTAVNRAGSARGVAIVNIDRQEYPAIEIYPNDVIDVQIGENALFQCLATAGSPTLSWKRANNEPYTRNTDVTENSGAIRFFQVTGAEQGSYICTGTSSAGTVSATATLRVQGAVLISIRPDAVRVGAGQRVFAECVAEGDPSAFVFWTTPSNTRIQGSRGSAILDISSATSHDSGTYKCTATNRYATAEKVLQVSVSGQPTSPTDGQHVSAAVQPQQIRVALGQTAEFRCSATGYPLPALHWTKVGGQMPDAHFVRDGILRIDRVSESDGGTYKCIARSQYGSGEVTVQLHVLVPPIISISPSMQTLRPGDHFLIQCTARGTEPIEIEWSKLYGSLSPSASEHRGVLEIASVTAADSGRYRCSASNDAGRAESLAELIILAPPGAVVSPKTIHMRSGATVEFKCEVTGSPHPRIQWLKQGGPLPEQHSVEAGTLTLFNIQSHDEGQYICMVTNEVGTTRDYGQLRVSGGTTGPVTGPVPVPDKREVLQVGDYIEINCEVKDEHQPIVRWIKVDGPMSPHIILENTKLIIPSATEADQGTYRCMASSVSGTVHAQVTLIIAKAPSIPVTRQSRTVSTGGRAVLTCRAHGDPQPSVQWSKRDGVLPRNHETQNGVLTIPIVRPEDFGEYVCIATNPHGFAEGVIILQSGELVPFFNQNPVSYMSYPTIRDAYKTFDIEISFKPQTTDGLILYNGQLDDGTGDFISFGLRNRRAELRLDVGSGPAIITTDPLELDQWHTVTIKRDGKDASLFVGGHEYKSQAPGSFIGLDLTENMYLGAVPDFRRISRLAGYTKGFVGCISQVVVSGVPLNLGGEVLDNDGITDCPVCQYRPCRNGGTCRPARVRSGYECFCPRNYSGVNCELVGERCTPGICGRRGRCKNLEDSTGYRCSCPVGITGQRCDQGSEIATPSFNSSSYITYPTIRDALVDVHLKLTFRADSLNNALLIYNGFSHLGDGDFIAVSIRDGHIHFQFDTGTGPADIQSREAVGVGEWITVVAERSRQDGSLSVNNGVAVKGKAPDPERGVSHGDTVGLNLKTDLYVGGVADLRVSPHAGILAGFKGCISELEISGHRVDLINDAISFKHILECGTGNSCASNPCRNGGTCLDRGDSFSCFCRLGFQGTVCSETEEVTVEMDAEFEGDGFIELPADLLPHASPLSKETVEFSVTTNEPNALLFWQGQPEGVQLRSSDYISVALENGFVVFSYELGSGPASIVSNQELNDGATHSIKVDRIGQQGTLEVDGFALYRGESAGNMTGLNTLGNIYLGGLPDIRAMTGGKYSRGLIGCISNIILEMDEPLDLSKEAVRGVNVKPCAS